MRRYYSSRIETKKISLSQVYQMLGSVYRLLRSKEFFREKTGISIVGSESGEFKEKAHILLHFQPFPIDEWYDHEINEDNVFSFIEFMFDNISMPGEVATFEDNEGYSYRDYVYDTQLAQKELRDLVNSFLVLYKEGFELNEFGEIVSIGENGLRMILNADITPYNKENVDDKVLDAISIWKKRKSSIADRKRAIQELADVFEWLKKTGKLDKVLNKKDESDIFNIANNFGIRHHNQKQKTNYDVNIWYSWIFHFYLASYHAVIKMLTKKEQNK